MSTRDTLGHGRSHFNTTIAEFKAKAGIKAKKPKAVKKPTSKEIQAEGINRIDGQAAKLVEYIKSKRPVYNRRIGPQTRTFIAISKAALNDRKTQKAIAMAEERILKAAYGAKHEFAQYVIAHI